jgi:hypothetical protein
MRTNPRLHKLTAVAATLVGVLFFFDIVGVFGVRLAISGLVVFVFGALVVYRTFPTEGREL